MSGRSSRGTFRTFLREFPADLGAVLVLTALVNVSTFAPVVRETALRIPLGLVFILFAPGYVFVAALFPEIPSNDTTDSGSESRISRVRSEMDLIKRVALSLGVSIAIVPLIGLVLSFVPVSSGFRSVMVALTVFTLTVTIVAAIRRRDLPEEKRFQIPYRDWYGTCRSGILEPDTRLDLGYSILVILSLVLLLGAVSFAITAPLEDEQFSTIYLLTEEEEDLTANNYPTEFAAGESEELIVGVENNEHRTVAYTVVAVEQKADVVDNRTSVTEQRELDRFETELDHDESSQRTYELEPTLTGENVRVVWLLYADGTVPDEPSMENADYYVYLWLSVTE
ncbi:MULTISPECIES: DUF1616 domain-containing protein [Natrialbaceae]|uniref:DUF1616 domain-containing protein n=1 Tax=Natrialbaceae TaxID=1644061 RepID=UPI00207CABD0|nr:DUF1616 domain-containing protein [Natronococcus sp. CG52]